LRLYLQLCLGSIDLRQTRQCALPLNLTSQTLEFFGTFGRRRPGLVSLGGETGHLLQQLIALGLQLLTGPRKLQGLGLRL
jgi:hypothetical protein